MTFIGTLNQSVFDWPWSLIHLGSGLIIGWLVAKPHLSWKRALLIGVGLLILWELFEGWLRWLDLYHHGSVATIKNSLGGAFFDRESWGNIVGDIVVGTFGIIAARTLRQRKKTR